MFFSKANEFSTTITTSSSEIMDDIRKYCEENSIPHQISVGPGWGNIWLIEFKTINETDQVFVYFKGLKNESERNNSEEFYS